MLIGSYQYVHIVLIQPQLNTALLSIRRITAVQNRLIFGKVKAYQNGASFSATLDSAMSTTKTVTFTTNRLDTDDVERL